MPGLSGLTPVLYCNCAYYLWLRMLSEGSKHRLHQMWWILSLIMLSACKLDMLALFSVHIKNKMASYFTQNGLTLELLEELQIGTCTLRKTERMLLFRKKGGAERGCEKQDAIKRYRNLKCSDLLVVESWWFIFGWTCC